MLKYQIPVWKEAPFIRITIPFITGILLAYYACFSSKILLLGAGVSTIGLILFYFISLKRQFHLQYANGVLLNAIFICFGGFIAAIKNPLPVEEFAPNATFVLTLDEPPLEKKSSWKALAKTDTTRIIVYFKKDPNSRPPPYGSTIVFSKMPQRVKNFIAGSSFDYERYCALKNIHYQVFLSHSDYILIDTSGGEVLYSFLFDVQRWVIRTLQTYIPGKKECGLAEALLIGYKNDLDNELIQSYSNTGVVHVVAISGLHLGLIYAMLKILCAPFGSKRAGRILKPVIILWGLWLFSLLAGASPSVLRAAVMFSFLVIGETVSKRSSMLNGLAASAFVLLYVDPYWLWDLGFILSYSALLSIMMFMKPIYNAMALENKLLDNFWKLNAVTLAAQVLTMPVLIYNFHQFPTLFLMTNIIAIPLSSVILLVEIVLCLVSFLPSVARVIGNILETLIRWMNSTVEYADSFPFSSVKGLNISFLQLLLLYIFIAWVFLVVLQPFKATR